MNFIQKKPQDSKHEEFHDGEYEFWPTEHLTKKKRAGFSAAFGSGLELIAAVGASGLLSMALTILYVLSSALSIGEHSAVINANVYNNRENQHISYILTTEANQDVILKEGILEDDEETLTLGGLGSGTTYLLRYFDPDQKEIGHFRFTTLGEFEDPIDPDSGSDVKQPAAPEPDDRKDPVEDPEAEKEPEAGTEATESTEATTEPTEATTEPTKPPIKPGYRPPVEPSNKPDPKPDPKPEPKPEEEIKPEEKPDEETKPEEKPDEETKPEEKPDDEPKPEPKPETPAGPSVKPEFEYYSSNSGVPYSGFDYTEKHIFPNIPADYKGIKVEQSVGGEDFVPTELEIPPQYTGGTLEITPPTLYVPPGEKLITRVTVDTGDGEVVSESVFAPPVFDRSGITLSLVEDVCVITASVLPEGAEPMSNCAAKLTMYNADDEPIYTKDSIVLYKDSSSDSYSGTCTVSTAQEFSYIEVVVTGSYFINVDEIYSDIATAKFVTF